MGIHDRDYIRVKRRSYDDGRVSPMGWTFTTWLIVVNVAIFFIDGLLLGGALARFGNFNTAAAFFMQTPTGQTVFGLEFWRFVTFQFLHANMLHLAFNMIALWIFGPLVESRMGFRRYAAFYLVCSIFGALAYLVLNLLGSTTTLGIPGLLFNDPRTPLIGASAGVFGVLMAAAYYRPNDRIVLLFPPIPLKIRTFAYIYVGIAAFGLLMGTQNAGGEAAHLGGAIAGYFFVRNSHLLHDFFDVFGKSPPPADSPKGRRVAEKRERLKSRAAAPSDAEIDRILAKVATQGLQSLSDSEKKALERASQSKRRG